DDGVHVRVSLAVRVRGEVERHVVEEDREVGPVIEVEAAQEVLVGLPTASMLRDDDAGNGLEELTAARDRAIGELGPAGRALAGRLCDAGHAVLATLDDDLGKRGWFAARFAGLRRLRSSSTGLARRCPFLRWLISLLLGPRRGGQQHGHHGEDEVNT